MEHRVHLGYAELDTHGLLSVKKRRKKGGREKKGEAEKRGRKLVSNEKMRVYRPIQKSGRALPRIRPDRKIVRSPNEATVRGKEGRKRAKRD